ncbi:MAG: MCP four helix bundle domain-containing protein, partial [Polaromonas sp.]
MKIGTRLGAGFALVLLMMASLVMVVMTSLAGIGDSTSKMVEKDWVKADAAHTINAHIRANARRTMELFFLRDAARISATQQLIESNKKIINDAVKVLETLIQTNEGKALLASFNEKRALYVASFGTVGKLLAEGRRDEADKLLIEQTLPALDRVQDTIIRIVELQKRMVDASGTDVNARIASTGTLTIFLGLLAVLMGSAFAWLITRSITRPMTQAVQVAQKVAAGDLTSRIEVSTQDETGQLLQALKDMNASLVGIVGNVRQGTDTIATASS